MARHRSPSASAPLWCPAFAANPLDPPPLANPHARPPAQDSAGVGDGRMPLCTHGTPMTMTRGTATADDSSESLVCRLCRVDRALEDVVTRAVEHQLCVPIKYVPPPAWCSDQLSSDPFAALEFFSLRNYLRNVSQRCGAAPPDGVDPVREEVATGRMAWDDIGRDARHWIRYHENTRPEPS